MGYIYSNYYALEGLFDGTIASDCWIPCTRTTPIVMEGTRVTMVDWPDPFFSIAFSDRVEIRKTTVDSFSFSGSLNYLGSNLGLWPGLGLYQILEWFVRWSLGFFTMQKIVTFFKLFDT